MQARTVHIPVTRPEQHIIGVIHLQMLYQNPKHSSRTRTNPKRWNEDARWDFDTKGDDGKCAFDDQSSQDGAHDGPNAGPRARVKHAKAFMVVARTSATLCEEVVHQLGAAHLGIRVQETKGCSEEGNLMIDEGVVESKRYTDGPQGPRTLGATSGRCRCEHNDSNGS